MSQNSSLIIKNGNCFINGEFKDQDILIENGKIKTIGKISYSNSSNIGLSEKYDIYTTCCKITTYLFYIF